MRKVQAFRDAQIIQRRAMDAAVAAAAPRKPRYRDRLGDCVPPTETEIRINNWKRAYRWIRPSDTNHTFPAYRFSRSTIGAEVEYLSGENPVRSPDPIDWADAWELELTWRELPRQSRWVLKLHLHAAKHPKHAIRLLRHLNPPIFIHGTAWAAAVVSALADLELELDMRKRTATDYVPVRFLIPVSAAAD